MVTVLIDEPLHPAILSVIPKNWEFVYMDTNLSREVLAKVEAVFTYAHPTINAEFLDRLPNLKIIANFGVGVAHIDVPEAKKEVCG